MSHYTTLPPRFAAWLLAACIHPADRDEVTGDLAEMFTWQVEDRGVRAARIWYRGQVIRSAPSFLIQSMLWRTTMLRNYLKLTLRTIRKQKTQAFINLSGLTIGIALCILILLFVRNELSFDRFLEGHEHIVQIQEWRADPDGTYSGGNTNMSLPMKDFLIDEVPGVTAATRVWDEAVYFRTGSDIFETEALFVDSNFLDVLPFPLTSGNTDAALNDRDMVVLSESAAKRFFGNSPAVGSSIEVRVAGEYRTYEVAGVAQDPPGNSSLQFDALLRIEPWIEATFPMAVGQYGWSLVGVYARTRPDVIAADLDPALKSHYAFENGDYLKRVHERDSIPDEIQPAVWRAVPLEDMYLANSSDPQFSYTLLAIGFTILLIACINFMVLAIGRSVSRSREVGIRKSVGAVRGQLLGQFWGEAFFMTLLSSVLGILLAWYALPLFNELTGKQLVFNLFVDWTIPVGILSVIIVTGLVSGSYPAIVLSSFRPIEVLKNRVRVSGSNLFTKSLVTLQFAVSAVLIIATLVMWRQSDFLETQDRGYNSDQMVLIDLNELDGPLVRDRFRQELENEPAVLGMSLASNWFGYHGSTGFSIDYEGASVDLDVLKTDENFLDMMGINLVEGRRFNALMASDSTDAVIVNQALVDLFGLEDPIGKTFRTIENGPEPTIIGVTDNFQYQSLYQNVGPLMMTMGDFARYRYLYVHLAPGNLDRSIERLQSTWRQVTADVPFSFEFMDDRMERVYASDLRWTRIINITSGFAIFLALLGLLGLTSLTVQNRTKEIGIRKVMGAGTLRIYVLILRDFAVMIGAGALLAIPVGILFTDRWLADYAFHADIGIGVYVAAISLVLAAALLTIGFQSRKTISTDPVKALRAE